MKTKKSILFLLCAVLTLCICLSFAACDEPDTEDMNLSAPTDFTFDPLTGDYSFKATDANMGYYFIRCYSVVNGKQAATYMATSSRINGGSTGTKSGTIDVSTNGWGNYAIKLISYAAAGSGYIAPDVVILNAQYGVGGKMERPEMDVITEGNRVELVIDYFSLNEYYRYQVMPSVTFNIYSDEDLTTLVKSDTVYTESLIEGIDTWPGPAGYNWGSGSAAFHLGTAGFGSTSGFENAIWNYTLPAGDYWVTATANGPGDYIESATSEAVAFTLTDTPAVGGTKAACGFVEAKTSLWINPSDRGFAMFTQNLSNRINYAPPQITTARIAP